MSYPVLRRGDSGPQVTALQKALNEAALHRSRSAQPIAADGVFGPATEGAVRTLQANAGVRVDGVVGQGTWALLEDTIGASLDVPLGAPKAPQAAQQPPVSKGSSVAWGAWAGGGLLVAGAAALAWKYWPEGWRFWR